MADIPEGAPCWADIVLTDLEAGKRFYGELFGWTFEQGSAEFGGYTTAFSGGRSVAALSPPAPGQPAPPAAWTLYFATADVQATASRIRDNGGELVQGPLAVGDLGSLLVAKDPGGAVFGAWQAGAHAGFEAWNEIGSFCWAELATHDVATADAFYPAVLPIAAKRMGDESDVDYKVWRAGDAMMTGRYPIGPGMPGPQDPQFVIYFAVPDCDAAVAAATKLGGDVVSEPVDNPFGRFAVVTDPAGAGFAVIDLTRMEGEPPPIEA